jgi:hypothetical protein
MLWYEQFFNNFEPSKDNSTNFNQSEAFKLVLLSFDGSKLLKKLMVPEQGGEVSR